MDRTIGFFRRYKLLHYPFWIWQFFDQYHFRMQLYGGDPSHHLLVTTIITAFKMLCVYTTIHVFLPKYLYKRRYGLFALFFFGTIIVSSLFTILSLAAYSSRVSLNFFPFQVFTNAVDILVVSAMFIAGVLLTDWYVKDQLNKSLERDKLKAELSLLKAQVNPHFLFNALNNIYVLINNDREMAGDILLKLSALLKYQIYDCVDQFTSLDKEFDFINNYIGLEKIRSNGNVAITSDLPASTGDFAIAPFILMPFVENAFKHVSRRKTGRNFIDIKASVGKELQFSVANNYDASTTVIAKDRGGVGLDNVRKRLEALYPAQHTLGVDKQGGVFRVNLILHAKKN